MVIAFDRENKRNIDENKNQFNIQVYFILKIEKFEIILYKNDCFTYTFK